MVMSRPTVSSPAMSDTSSDIEFGHKSDNDEVKSVLDDLVFCQADLLFFIHDHSCISPNYMENQFDINSKMRAILIDWIIELASGEVFGPDQPGVRRFAGRKEIFWMPLRMQKVFLTEKEGQGYGGKLSSSSEAMVFS